VSTVFSQVCRWDLTAPGFARIDLDLTDTTAQLLSLHAELSARFLAETGRILICRTSERFDQRASGPLHRDGGPDEALLLLAYLPTITHSEPRICDFARCAVDQGMAPAALLEAHNPMFGAGAALLAPYTCPIPGFVPERGQIVVINNSITAPGEGMLGLLHGVTVQPDPPAPRMLLSMQLVPADPVYDPPL